MGENPKPTTEGWKKLAKEYLKKADYREIFPKLPSMLATYYTKWKGTQQLVAMKDSVEVDYYGLLKQLGQPSEDTITENPAVAFQKESSTPPDAAAAVLDELTVPATVSNLDELPENPMPVAPLAAPTQTQYNVSSDSRKNGGRKCSGAPFGCLKLAKDCSGRNGGWRSCQYVASSQLSASISDEEAKVIIKEHHNKHRRERKAAKAAERRAAKDAQAVVSP